MKEFHNVMMLCPSEEITDTLVKKFQKKCMMVIKDCKERQYFTKPSAKRHKRNQDLKYLKTTGKFK